MKTALTPLALLLVPITVACGGTDEGGVGDEPTDDSIGGEPSGPDCDPDAEIPCIEGIAEPCEDFETGFDGDEYCRAAPDPSVGMQVHVGPDDYTDPDQIAQYIIEPGDETNWAEVVQFPNTEAAFVRGYRSYMRPGSHHFIMYGTDQNTQGDGPIQNGDGTESAVGIDGRFLGGATKAIQNIDTKGVHPEDQGIGTEIPANSFVAMNLHFVNTSDHGLLQEIWVNFIDIPEEEVTSYVKPITWYGGLGMNIPPGVTEVVTNAGQSVCAAPGNIRVGMMTGHIHASTSRETTLMNGETILFEEYDWAEPTEWRYRRDIENPTPDPEIGLSGGYSGLLEVQPSDTFTWECEVTNGLSDQNMTFGNRVYTGEMCMVFGFYMTEDRNAAPWGCFFF